MRQINADQNGTGLYNVAELKGQYVKRKENAQTVYKVIGYDRAERKWQLDDTNDISRCIYLKPGTMVYAGFTY